MSSLIEASEFMCKRYGHTAARLKYECDLAGIPFDAEERRIQVYLKDLEDSLAAGFTHIYGLRLVA